METEYLLITPALSFEEWMMTLEFSENTIQSRLSNLAKLEKCYGPLKELWKKDQFQSLLDELAYATEDKRNNVEPTVKIPVSGNVYEGLATYRSTLRLYGRYLQYLQNLSALPFGIVGKAVHDAIDNLKKTLSGRVRYTQQDVKKKIIEPLVYALNQALQAYGYNFYAEKTASEVDENGQNSRDRYDIIGICATSMALPTVVIEVDTHRSDQISKKVVSRIALNSGSKLYYVALIYPNNHVSKEAEKKECAKYFLYIDALFNELKLPEKKFKGYLLY